LFEIRSRLFFEKILRGESSPLGKVRDWWGRVEFQGRGTPHIHMILFILLQHFFASDDLETAEAFAESEAAQAFANEKLSAWLEDPPSDAEAEEWDETFKPKKDEYDDKHPSSIRVDPTLDYGIRAKTHAGGKEEYVANRTFNDENVRLDMRSVVLANQMHVCCATCHKYGHTLDCRFCFPFCVNLDEPDSPDFTGFAAMRTRRGRRSRMRVTVEAPRNNENVNRHAAMPAVLCCWRGNMDQTCVRRFKFVDIVCYSITRCFPPDNDACRIVTDAHGAATYAATYSSKAEEPDSKLMFNIITRAMGRMAERNERPSTRDMFRTVLNAVLSSTRVGATQVAYVLLNLPFVIRSREVMTVNALPRDLVALRVKRIKELKTSVEHEGDAAPAVDTFSIGSNLGRRNAYSLFVNAQNALDEDEPSCVLTFFDVLTYYNLSRGKVKVTDDDDGEDACDALADESCLHDDIEDDGIGGEASLTTPSRASSSLRWAPLSTVLRKTAVLNADGHTIGTTLCADAPKTFSVDGIRFSLAKTPNVLSLCPYMSYDLDDEASAYAILLMHRVWPDGDEGCIVPPGVTAVCHLAGLIRGGEMTDIEHLIGANRRIRTDLATNGTPMPGFFGGDGEDDNLDEEDHPFDDGEVELDPRAPEDDSDFVAEDTVMMTSPSQGECFIRLSQSAYAKGQHCITKIVLATKAKSMSDNTRSHVEEPCPVERIHPYKNKEELVMKLASSRERIETVEMQRKTFGKIEEHLRGSKQNAAFERLKMVVTGPGGTGKTELIHATVTLARLLFGRTLGTGGYGPVIVIAPSGSSAANAGGYTWQWAAHATHQSTYKAGLGIDFDSKMQLEFDGLEVIIFDEMSMLSPEALYDLERRFRCSQKDPVRRELFFGGRHVIFLGTICPSECHRPHALTCCTHACIADIGDFYQLPPVKAPALYTPQKETDNAWQRSGLRVWNEFNTFAELTENVRDGCESTLTFSSHKSSYFSLPRRSVGASVRKR